MKVIRPIVSIFYECMPLALTPLHLVHTSSADCHYELNSVIQDKEAHHATRVSN